MKGLTHFVSGVAVASCFPQAVQNVNEGSGWLLVLGGVCGILSDTLDFRFGRFFARHDREIRPSEHGFDPQEIADALAEAINSAQQTGGPYRIKLHTLRVGADWWRQYFVEFDSENREVIVRLGPIVNTGQIPLPRSLPATPREGRARVDCRVIQQYDLMTRVDIFSGPSFSMIRRAPDAVEVLFIPWHRNWSHSIPVTAALGLLLALAFGPVAGWIGALAFGFHILEDQFGKMGSALFWPFNRERFKGFGSMRSADALPNFGTVWIALTVILWNLNRFADPPAFSVSLPVFLLAMLGIPAAFIALGTWLTRDEEPETEQRTDADEYGEEVSA